MVKISGRRFKNPLRKQRRQSDSSIAEKAPGAYESLEPTLSEDEDELSIASFSLRPCTHSTRGDTTRGHLPPQRGNDSSSDSFLADDVTMEESSPPTSETEKEISKIDMLKYLMKMESQRTFRTVTTVEEEQEDDEIHVSDHFRASFPHTEDFNSQDVIPKSSNISSHKSIRSSSKSPKTGKLRKKKKVETNDLPSHHSPGKLKKKKKKSISTMPEELTNEEPRKGKNGKAKKTKVAILDSSIPLELDKSFRSLDNESNQRAKTRSKRKPKKKRSSVETEGQPTSNTSIGSIGQRRRQSGAKSQIQPKRHSSVEPLSQPKMRSSEKSKTQPKRKHSLSSSDRIPDVHNPSFSYNNRSPESQMLKKRISGKSNEAPESDTNSSLSNRSTSGSEIAKERIGTFEPSDDAPDTATNAYSSEMASKRIDTSGSEMAVNNRIDIPSDEAPDASSNSSTIDIQAPTKRTSAPDTTKNLSPSSSSLTSGTEMTKERSDVPSDVILDANDNMPLEDGIQDPSSNPAPSDMATYSNNASSKSSSTSASESRQQPTSAICPLEAMELNDSLDLKHTSDDTTLGVDNSDPQEKPQEIQSPRLALARKRKQATLEKLVTKFNEAKLDNSSSFRFNQDPTEYLLKEETEHKEELQLQVQKLQEQLDNIADREGVELNQLKEAMQKLETQNSRLQKENAQYEETIYSLRLAEKEMKRKLLIGGKAQGELLLLRSMVSNKTTELEKVSSDLVRVKQELDTLREDSGVEFLQVQVETLEEVKKVFAAEIEVLKKELEKTKRKLQAATDNITSIPAATTTSWFQRSSDSNQQLQEILEQTNTSTPTTVGTNEGSWWSRSLPSSLGGTPPQRSKKSNSNDIVNDLNGKLDLIDTVNKSDRPEFLARATRLGVSKHQSKITMKRHSGGIFKNRVRQPRIAKKATVGDDVLEPTACDDDVSASSSSPQHDEARWSIEADKNININEGDDDDEDIYTSDREDETADTKEMSDTALPCTSTTSKNMVSKSPKSTESPKRKKVKKIDTARPMPSLGNLKKEKGKSSAAAAASIDSNKSKKKRKKGKKGKSKKSTDNPADVPTGFQSFADSDKHANSRKSKCKSKKNTKSEGVTFDASGKKTASVTKLSIRSNLFFQNNPLYMSFRNNFVSKKNLSICDNELQSPSKEQSNTSSSAQPKDVDGKRLKADAVSKIRAFAIFRDRIQDQKQFLAAFNNAEEASEADDATLTQKRQRKQNSFNKLVNELENYETMLEKERAELSNTKASMQLQQESVEQLLQDEIQKNEGLQLLVQQLQEQLDEGCEAAQLEQLKEENRVLEAENELLRQTNERHQNTIASMMIVEKSEMRRKHSSVGPLDRKPSLDSYLVSPSTTTRRKFRPTRPSIAEDCSMELRPEDVDDSPDWDEQSGYMSMASMSGKAQGELLQLRSTLKNKDIALEEQAIELAQIKEELATLKEDQGVKNLTSYIENLETEKKFFVSMIEKLKKEVDEARKREHEAASKASPAACASVKMAAPTTPRQAAKDSVGSGWFGFGTIRTPSKMESKDIVNDLNGSMVSAAPWLESETIKEQPARLSGILNF
ncbi:MAG: hypothetical protein SGBAC_005099 [Bacillariaceae sp.]